MSLVTFLVINVLVVKIYGEMIEKRVRDSLAQVVDEKVLILDNMDPLVAAQITSVMRQ